MFKKVKRVLWAAVITAAMTGSVSSADELSELKLQLQQLQDKVASMESKQTSSNEQLMSKLSEVEAQKSQGQVPDSLKWAENIKLKGDFRYRYEMIDEEGKDTRNRNRIRARIGLDAKINDDLDFGLRIATGSDEDGTSTNQDTGGMFSTKNIWLDRAYLDYHGFENINLIAGKMGNPFHTVGGSQLIWDGDLNPEGGAFKYKTAIGDNTTMFTNLGAMWVEENSSDVDQGLFGAQVGFTTAIGDGKLTLGTSYYDYGNLKDELLARKGNSRDPITNTFVYDYDLLEVFASYDFKAGELPISVYGDYVKNIASGVQEDTGWLLGAKFGKVSGAGTWDFGYSYRDLEKDAVVGAFSDSDFAGGGTGGKGHTFSFGYGLAKNFSTGITYLVNEKESGADYNRLQVDLSLKF